MSDKTKTAAQLEKENAALQQKLEAATKRAEKAEKAAGTVETLKRQLAETTEALKVAEATKAKSAKPVVKVGNAHFVVRSGVRRKDGTPVSRQDLAKNPELCAELVASGSAILQKVKTK